MRSTRVAVLLLVLAFAASASRLCAQAAVPDSLSGNGPMKVPLAREGGAPGAGAVTVRTLARGQTVRVVSAAGSYFGTIERISADTIVVGAPGRLDVIQRGDVTSIQRMAGRSSRGQAMARGAGVGLIAGGVLGAIAGRMVGRVHCGADQSDGCVEGSHDSTIQGALLAEGALVGSLLGVMIGPTFRRTRWEDAQGAFPAAAASGGGVAAGVSLRF